MTNFKIIAGPILNLSDARYFAARGVDVLIYRVGSDIPFALREEEYHAIREWVEVPGEVIWSTPEHEEHVTLGNRKMSITDTLEEEGDLKDKVLDLSGISLELLRDRVQVILQFAGVLVRGGDEERVGFKSFEQMDTVMDFLDEIKNPDSP